jgi:hypothetical protein
MLPISYKILIGVLAIFLVSQVYGLISSYYEVNSLCNNTFCINGSKKFDGKNCVCNNGLKLQPIDMKGYVYQMNERDSRIDEHILSEI